MTGKNSEALDAFFSALTFTPDRFQVEALDSIASNRSVVVTAPTGSGKTLIAQGAIALSVAHGTRAFYTTPIKALSNQKFNDLVAERGEAEVGLLTGDNVINGDAPIVVMTTEVLRNMIYEGSPALEGLGTVVLDEVHYLADRHRGSVWEEIIIHLDTSVPIVCLSATIANAEEFTEWVRSRRGPTALIIETDRPVPLTSMYMWKDRHREGAVEMLPVFGSNGRPNTSISKLLGRSQSRFRRFTTPRRTEVASHLSQEGLLPAIYFVFSRKGCDQAAEQVAAAGLELTDSDDRKRIRAIVERHVAHLSPSDLTVLGYERWRSVLERGSAAHHAGLIPAFKETVEELFIEGLIQFVAATETLALGINMPAKTVVLESLSKFNGETHELLQPSDYTQLTGRAGRRGIDTEGTAVVLHSGYVPFDRVSGIAAAGANALRSSFAPTYNMAVNLIARYDSPMAHRLLGASFANFTDTYRTDALVENLAERRRDLATFRDAAACDRGDIWEFTSRNGQSVRPELKTASLQPGNVIEISGTMHVILGRSWGGNRPKLELTDSSGRKITVQSADLPRTTMILGSLALPEPVRVSDRHYRNEIADHLEAYVPLGEPRPVFDVEESTGIETCPDLDDHIRWVGRASRAERDIRRLERRLSRSPRDDITAEFDRLTTVLESRGYTRRWTLTAKGQQLRRLYNELDLLLAESLIAGSLADLDPAEFCAIASIFTYESRGGDVPQMPHTAFAARPLEAVLETWEELSDLEASQGLTPMRPPDVGFVDTVFGWASGFDLDEIFDEEDFRAGDFVRSARQLLDLLRQIRDGFSQYRDVATAAIATIDRGIVSADTIR